jgi:hypothetical protein
LDKTITVYIPSKRMRNLLKKWLSMWYNLNRFSNEIKINA